MPLDKIKECLRAGDVTILVAYHRLNRTDKTQLALESCLNLLENVHFILVSNKKMMKSPSLNIKYLPESKKHRRIDASLEYDGRSMNSPKYYKIPFKFRQSDDGSMSRISVRNKRHSYEVFRLIISCTILIRLLMCVTVIFISLNFSVKYIRPAIQIYALARPALSAQILIKSLGSLVYVFCGIEVALLGVQLVSLLTFISKQYAFYGISITVDFVFLFLFLLSYLPLIAIGLNSSDVSATLIAEIGTLLNDDDPKKFMHMINDVQVTMECCGFVGNYKEWMQNKTFYYYDPIKDESKTMLGDQAQDIWKSQNYEEEMNSTTLFCCSNIKKHCSEKRMRQQSCLNKLSISIAWLMELIGTVLALKFMLSVLQEVIFTYIAVDITTISTTKHRQ
ncbi:Recombination protein RecR [Dirofilaria immitis]